MCTVGQKYKQKCHISDFFGSMFIKRKVSMLIAVHTFPYNDLILTIASIIYESLIRIHSNSEFTLLTSAFYDWSGIRGFIKRTPSNTLDELFLIKSHYFEHFGSALQIFILQNCHGFYNLEISQTTT